MASPLAAQLFLSPTIGAYIPTTELFKAAQGQEFKQEVAVAVGGRLGLPLRHPLRSGYVRILRTEQSPIHLQQQ